MKEVKTQFGTAVTADFEESTWTFKMPEDFSVWPGNFAIVDIEVYKQLVKVFCENSDNSDLIKLL